MPSAGRGAVDFASINSDMDPSTPNTFDIGKVGAEWRNARIGNNLVVGGNLTVEGAITTIESTTLTVEDKNIELASTPSPTDALADGGGITLKGTTDKTILWRNATDSWDFNQKLRSGNLELDGNAIRSTNVDGDILLAPNGTGVVQLGTNLDTSGFSIIDGSGVVNIEAALAIGDNPSASGGLRLTNGESITAKNNFNNGDIVLLASAFLNARDVVVIGNATDDLQIPSGGPGVNKVLTSDATGITTWEVATGGGWVDDGTVVRLATGSDNVVIGANTGFGAKLQVSGPGGVSVGGFPSGVLHVTSDSSAQFENAVITGHNLFGGNTQLWYLGSVSGSNDDVRFFNRQAGNLFLGTNNTTFFTMNAVGNITVGPLTATQLTADNLRLDGNVLSSIDTNGIIIIDPNGTGAILLTTDKVLMLGTSPAATGDNSELVEMRDDRTTTGENPNYVLSINQQNGTLSVLSMGNDGNANAILVTHNNDLRIGNDVAGTFTENMRFTSDGKAGFGTQFPDASAILDLTSTTEGFLPPRMTTAQVAAITSPAIGLIVYDTDIEKLKLSTPTAFQNLLSEDLGQVVAQDSFVSTNVRYFGELGLPGSQVGWTETGTGVISIEVGDNVFGVIKDTVKHFSTTGNSTKSESPITGTDWDNILAFGASFSAITRITEATGNSMFAGVGFSPANDPRASSIESRTGMFISVNATHTTIQLDGQAIVVLDGTGGNPLVLKDEWFTWEAVLNPTPDAGVSFGVVDVYVNNILIVTGTVVSSNNAVSDEISLANSSSSGQTTFYADNFGITIYEESATKTLSATLMSADVAQITIPEGKRDYTIILPDGNPRKIGAVLRMVANNLFGKVTLENQNPAAPQILYNGLRTFVINVAVKEIVDGVNTVDQANVYLGFQTSDIDQTKTIFAQLSSSVDQDPVDTNPTVITFNTQDAIAGLTHSTTVNSGEITVVTEGVYFISPQPQVGKTSGATKTDFDIFLQVDRGSGFVDAPNSNIKLTIKDSDITDVAVSALGISLNVGDKIRLMQRVSSSSVGMGLKATAAETGPPTIPATPAIILDMHRVGGLAV